MFPDLCLEDSKVPSIVVPFELKENSRIVRSRPYRLLRERYIWTQKKITELKEKGIIVDSKSSYASPCVVVPKENGGWRLCQDYREINKETNLDPFPFPIIDDIINNFDGCTHFSKVDLRDGFWQLGITEETRKYTAFVTPFGLHKPYQQLIFG